MRKEIEKFEDLDISENVKKAIKEMRFVQMTEIQKQAIPYILEGRDVVGQSQTGTGKTASFGLPMIERIDKTSKQVQSIILCPTRELAVQVTYAIRRYLKYEDNIKCMAIYGGESIDRQILNLKKGVQIIIGTPGRVMDHLRRRTIRLNNVKMVILDEADEMLNMGFEEDIETILKYVPEDRQTVLFSATMSKRILEISKKYLNKPKNIKIESKELTVERIKQEAIEVKARMKDEAVCRILDVEQPTKAIVFCNTKKKADTLIEILKTRGYKAECLHGDIKQSQRDRIMKKVRMGDTQILVATDVAARGIDVKNLELVINYDIPQELEYYVHRIGRTGRNGKGGVAYTFYTGKEKTKLKEIEKYANTKINIGTIPTLKEVKEVRVRKFVQQLENVIKKHEFRNTEVVDALANKKYSFADISKALATMFINEQSEENSKYKFTPDENGNVRLFLSVGRKDSVMVKDIVGCLKSHTALTNDTIGRVNLLDNFSFVDVPADFVEEVMDSVKGKVIKGKKVNIEIANQ
ncbi:MAG: DEAD/DEAH box helicase [Clostridia bacterium]|nr:DEAD/DEAH box helicase [Clostridia bacterium]